MARYHGIKIAREAGYNRLFCYSDSKMVLDLISKDRNSFHCYAATIAKIRNLLKLEWELSLRHSLRERNFCADFLTELGSVDEAKTFYMRVSAIGYA
ncbi:ribonuclease H [Trifolium pratense]|uniref:Ribonuclease H n=1 Tax=Trifolium pratense TaxID=57577 RepID=A0A2K3MPZ8_TRIPR|nr:ribonuclease H [Trifolium pratense]